MTTLCIFNGYEFLRLEVPPNSTIDQALDICRQRFNVWPALPIQLWGYLPITDVYYIIDPDAEVGYFDGKPLWLRIGQLSMFQPPTI